MGTNPPEETGAVGEYALDEVLVRLRKEEDDDDNRPRLPPPPRPRLRL
jgi:hypothetical protein